MTRDYDAEAREAEARREDARAWAIEIKVDEMVDKRATEREAKDSPVADAASAISPGAAPESGRGVTNADDPRADIG